VNAAPSESGGDPGYRRLVTELTRLAPGLIAVSGGLDSRFLAHVARRLGLPFHLLHLTGPHIPAAESRAALAWCAGLGLPHHRLTVDPLALPEVLSNTRERCYACKKQLFAAAMELAGSLGLANVLEGSQASDTTAFRPGRRALAELGVKSPLAEAGLTKPDIRRLGATLGLSAPDQPARPCLLTRLDYGLSPDAALLVRLAAAEEALAALGLVEFRLRLTAGGSCLQIASAEAEKARERAGEAAEILARHGFAAARMLLTESVSGFFDKPDMGGRP